ncbi:hypothetical protein E2542_SST27605 [Spatholobus suberectus]|nr:hypothetical protein E2542_SST27605 [Spatholobus suberectus]
MDDVPYLGLMPSNVDILVHFTKRSGAPNTIRNVDPNKFSIFDAHNAVNELAEDNDNGLAPCYPFGLGFLSSNVGKILPLNVDSDVLKMFTDNKGCTYVHMYVSRNRNEFLKEPRIDAVNVSVNFPVDESVNENVEAGNSSANEARNEGDMQEPNICPDKVYVSDDDVSYDGVESGSGNSKSDFDPIGECEDGDLSDENESGMMSDFEERVHVAVGSSNARGNIVNGPDSETKKKERVKLKAKRKMTS